MRITDFLTPPEIERAWAIYCKVQQDDSSPPFSVLVEREIITPNLDRINGALGQENDTRYLAYAVEYVFMKVNQGNTQRFN
jgi:hypothetical protein